MDKYLKKFSEELAKCLGSNLISFIVYGSTATGEFYKDSDFNTLVVLEKIDTKSLTAIAKPVEKWVKKGQPIPLVFTRTGLLSSHDVFPIEFLDIIENHVVLAGVDIFEKMEINKKNLRLEIEKEFKSKLIRLAQSYVVSGRNTGKVKTLLTRSISSIIALIKASIRLYETKAPSKKREVINAAPDAFALDKKLFDRILDMKEGIKDIPNGEVEVVFGQYMKEVEKMADIIDAKE